MQALYLWIAHPEREIPVPQPPRARRVPAAGAAQLRRLAPPVQALEAHDDLGLSYRRLAQALQADESTLHRWHGGAEPSRVFQARLAALEEFLAELRRAFPPSADVLPLPLDKGWAEGAPRRPFGSPEARAWLARPLPALAGRRPLDLLAESRLELLTRLLYGMESLSRSCWCRGSL